MEPETHFLLVDDHPIVLSALGRLLGESFPGAVIYSANSYHEAVALAERKTLDVAVVDLELGSVDGVELIKFLSGNWPNLGVLVLSLHNSAAHAERSLRAGARAYVPKSEAPSCILEAIHAVRGGGYFLPPKIALEVATLSTRGNMRRTAPNGARGLSEREIQIFNMIGQGLSLQKIADQLFLSVKTIETYRSRLKEKMGLQSAQLLREKAVEWRLAGKE